MKKQSIYIAVCLLFTVTSCKKYLEHVPDNRTQLDTPEKVAQLLGTAYPQANYMIFTESISDNVADKGVGEVQSVNADPYLFKDVEDNEQDSPEYYWNACYTAIAAANQALDAIEEAADPNAYSAQKGEALIARAYTHFMLVTLFSKVYDPATAGTDPGVPYVTEPETVVFKQYERKTVSYVYEMIEKDLVEGLPLLNDNIYKIPRYHFTKAAAHAFATRFYLFKKDYAKVIEHANQVVPGNDFKSSMRPWNTTYLTMTFNELFGVYAKATEPANLLLVETVSRWPRYYYRYRYSLDAVKQAEILNDNVTGGTWAFVYQVYTAGTNNYLIPKIYEHFVTESINANTGIIYEIVPLLTVEEVLFNRAEASLHLGNTNAALEDLNTYASTRIRDYNAASHSITAAKIRSFYGIADPSTGILLTILDFKRAEYVQEGMRWFDLLRYKIPVVHTTTDGQTLQLGADDPRRVFQLPSSVSASGLALNPR